MVVGVSSAIVQAMDESVVVEKFSRQCEICSCFGFQIRKKG